MVKKCEYCSKNGPLDFKIRKKINGKIVTFLSMTSLLCLCTLFVNIDTGAHKYSRRNSRRQENRHVKCDVYVYT